MKCYSTLDAIPRRTGATITLALGYDSSSSKAGCLASDFVKARSMIPYVLSGLSRHLPCEVQSICSQFSFDGTSKPAIYLVIPDCVDLRPKSLRCCMRTQWLSILIHIWCCRASASLSSLLNHSIPSSLSSNPAPLPLVSPSAIGSWRRPKKKKEKLWTIVRHRVPRSYLVKLWSLVQTAGALPPVAPPSLSNAFVLASSLLPPFSLPTSPVWSTTLARVTWATGSLMKNRCPRGKAGSLMMNCLPHPLAPMGGVCWRLLLVASTNGGGVWWRTVAPVGKQGAWWWTAYHTLWPRWEESVEDSSW